MIKKDTKVAVLGAGAMGSAFTVPCIENKNDVTLVGTHLEEQVINNINNKSGDTKSRALILFLLSAFFKLILKGIPSVVKISFDAV